METVPQRLAAAVRTVSDFPEPGVRFKDITPILADARLLREAVAALAQPSVDEGPRQRPNPLHATA